MNFNLGDQVRINQGVFEDYQGQVINIDRTWGRAACGRLLVFEVLVRGHNA
jgi:transcription antitermination factor NusG